MWILFFKIDLRIPDILGFKFMKQESMYIVAQSSESKTCVPTTQLNPRVPIFFPKLC